MFGFVQLQGSQLLKFWPETRSNNLISPNISEHVRTFFVLFVCPTTEHSLPLSIERKNCSWDHLGGRKKEDCAAPPPALSGVEPPQLFLEFFLEFFWSRVWQSAGAFGSAIWVHRISKSRVMVARRAHRTNEGAGEAAPGCVVSGRPKP